jgi:alkylation response protein AidB-like acyl-CoA dehydrogenase
MGGISLLLVERDMAGVTIRRQKTQGWLTSGTALITLDEVKVPVANLIGKENDGFLSIMNNLCVRVVAARQCRADERPPPQ